MDNELYDTKIDKIDEILYVRDQITALQQQNQTKVLGLLSQEHQNYLT
jgi:hypothetical protein